MSNRRTHPQPLLLKREGAKTSSFRSFSKVPLLVREGFRVSLLILTQSIYGVDLINKLNLGFSEGIPWIATNVGLVVASQSDPFGKSL